MLLTGLLYGSLPILSTHLLVEVVCPPDGLLLLLGLFLSRARSVLHLRLIEVAVFSLVALHFSLLVKLSVTFDHFLVVCRVEILLVVAHGMLIGLAPLLVVLLFLGVQLSNLLLMIASIPDISLLL